MMVPMPAAIVLIVCKTVISGPPDQNAGFTRAENREWATEHAMMVCRREEVQMFDKAEAEGAAPQPFNAQRCQRSAMMLVRNGTRSINPRPIASGAWRAPFPSCARMMTAQRTSSPGSFPTAAIAIR